MTISLEETKNIANLSRIAFTDEELIRFQSSLEKILAYVDELKSIPTHNVEPLSTVTGLVNVFRKDDTHSSTVTEAILANAPQLKDGYYKVKTIL